MQPQVGSSLELDQTKAQCNLSNDNNVDLEEEILYVRNECYEAINRMDDAQDKFLEEHASMALAADSNLTIDLQALAELRETYAALLQELDKLSAAVQVENQLIGSSIESI
jgi:hypothetical protein